jgi:hypothetical protein
MFVYGGFIPEDQDSNPDPANEVGILADPDPQHCLYVRDILCCD